MLKNIDIDHFRGCEKLHIRDFASLNLLVGRNNSGKTTVLEAIQLLLSAGDPIALWSSMARRGERHADDERTRSTVMDISHLFYGHILDGDAEFSIGGEMVKDQSRWIRCKLQHIPSESLFDESSEEVEDFTQSESLLRLEGNPEPSVSEIPVSLRGGITSDFMRRSHRTRSEIPHVEFVHTDISASESLFRVWREIVLTDEEDLVTESLRVLEPSIERVAVIGDPERPYRTGSRSGVLVKVEGYRHPIPLGNMGEGMWRMLTMSLALIRASGGVLLIDEIDTGLHYSVLRQMWELISLNAKRLNVQVFATTHSSDCIRALASVIRTSDLSGHAELHRIEKNASESVTYSESEIVEAASSGVEVR